MQCEATLSAQDIIGTSFVTAVLASDCLHGQTYENTFLGSHFASKRPWKPLCVKHCLCIPTPGSFLRQNIAFLVSPNGSSTCIIEPFSFLCQIVYVSSQFHLLFSHTDTEQPCYSSENTLSSVSTKQYSQ